MQPYFLPYIGYWQLMNRVDNWIIFDDIQYIHKGWVNRNSITNMVNNEETMYLNIPVSGRKNNLDQRYQN